jgi:hypothetical protein
MDGPAHAFGFGAASPPCASGFGEASKGERRMQVKVLLAVICLTLTAASVAAQTNITNPALSQSFNSFTTTPVEGVTTPRTFRLTFGVGSKSVRSAL